MRVKNTSKRRQGGQAIVMFTLLVSSVLIPMVGLAIDGGRGYLVRLKLSSAVDGGALAAARLLGSGSNAAQQLSMAKATAAQFVNANFPAKFFGASLSGAANVCVDPGTDSSDPCGVGNGSGISTYKVRTVAVKATATMPTLFMRIIGMPTVTVSGSGTASRRDVRVILVMDRSSSMGTYYSGINQTPPSINDMALKFVNSFSGAGEFGGRDEVGLVVYGGSGIVAYPPRDITKDYTDYTKFTPPDNNFKASGNIPKYIADITSGSNTGTAEALYLAYMTLRADAATNPDLATKLNVIVLFTDGIPNGVTAMANDKTIANQHYLMIPNCTNLGLGDTSRTPMLSGSPNPNIAGWFAQWGGNSYTDNSGPHGFHKPMMAYADTGYTGKGDDIDSYMKNPGHDGGKIDQMTGTGCTADPMVGELNKLPDHDIYGNYLNLSAAPAVSGLTPPVGSAGALYKLGTLYSTSTQCNNSSYNPSAPDNACQMGLGSWQAAAHQAWKIWNQIIWDKATQTNIPDPATNKASPVIFTIGFESTASDLPDMKLLQLIANDPSSPAPFSTRVQGKAYNAKDPNAVDAAFQQIRSEILRLSR
uniref:von Willebrand factor, type A n=1 Tax=Solibacter usitatus (strain Ellin6076) TaxID=234267 RepID=Q01XW3_SOLUE